MTRMNVMTNVGTFGGGINDEYIVCTSELVDGDTQQASNDCTAELEGKVYGVP